MLRASTLISASIGLMLSPAVIAGQTSTLTSSRNPEQPFAAINASLLNAVDSAIETGSAGTLPPDVRDHPLQAQTLAVPVASSQRTSHRLDPLGPIVQPILAREGVPNQLSAVIRVESGGNPMALSPKGARGLWQLMPDTARRYGLRVDNHFDERLDIEKSTTGAARYLRDLYIQFGSWPLALAAYNTGEVNLQRAIDRAHSRDLSILTAVGHLPLETQNYVPAVLAAMQSQLPSPISFQENPRPAQFVYATSQDPHR